ncbi:MAG: methyltransferase domain-containing protein [Clostridia bacterium]|nr:methyltransferase domain-containing protein [Clostridia bacterium]
MIQDVIICPKCGSAFSRNGSNSLVCRSGHCYDIASSGYVNFAESTLSGSGDSKEMIRARHSFLAAGYYLQAADAICSAVSDLKPRTLVDAGCGEGYYTMLLSASLETAKTDVMGFDLSKEAIKTASKCASRAAGKSSRFFVASIFELPVASSSVDVVTDIFAPCAGNEFYRIIRDGGWLVVAVAGKRHLFGLKSVLYSEPYENEIRRDVIPGFRLENVSSVDYSITVAKEHIASLFMMTPYYFRTSIPDSEKLYRLESLETEVCFDILTYQREK